MSAEPSFTIAVSSSSLMMRRMSEGDMWKGLMPCVVKREAPSVSPEGEGREFFVRSHVVLVLPLSAVRVYIGKDLVSNDSITHYFCGKVTN